MHGARLSPSDWHERGRRVFREEVEDDPDAEAGFLDDQCMRGARDDRQLGIRDAAVRCKRWPIEIVDSCVHRDVHNYPRSSPTRSFGPITARRSMVGESNSIKSTSRVARRRAPSTAGSSARRRRVGGRLPSSHLARRGEARARARADPRRPGIWFGDSAATFRIGLAYEPPEKLANGLDVISAALQPFRAAVT